VLFQRAEQHKIPQDFLYPLLPSSRYLKFFTFAKSDWEELRDGDKECYLFLCHMPRNQLPESVRRYIELGEGSKAQIRLRRRPGEAEGGPVSESQASQTRRKHRNVFFDWYDLGGVVKAPIIASYYAQYWHRFALTLYNTACDADIIALIPLQGKTFNLNELKALLLYLNSSIAKLYLEANGRSTGGGALAIEANVLNDMPILDVRKLSVEEVERLAELFDKLESEARKLGGADTAENIFGSELAEELTGKRDVEANVIGLYSTTIKEIDYEIARILKIEHLIEAIRVLVIELIKRRLSRTGKAEREAIKGSEEVLEIEKPKKRTKQIKAKSINSELTEFFEES